MHRSSSRCASVVTHSAIDTLAAAARSASEPAGGAEGGSLESAAVGALVRSGDSSGSPPFVTAGGGESTGGPGGGEARLDLASRWPTADFAERRGKQHSARRCLGETGAGDARDARSDSSSP